MKMPDIHTHGPYVNFSNIVKGAKIFCREGHYVCKVAVDPRIGSPIMIDDFDDWQVRKPEAWDNVGCYCGALYGHWEVE